MMGVGNLLRDKEIREPLFDFLDECYGKIRIIEEKTMGKSRADVVMVVPDALYGIEIKSDADTYARLSSQVRDYDKYYDYNFVVVGTSHALHIREHVPEYWGVITVELVDDVLDFYILRQPQINPKVTWKKKMEILWRPELAQLQELYQMPKYKEKSKAFVVDKIVERLESGKIDESVFKEQVSNILLERDYNTVAEKLVAYRKGEITKKLEREKDPAKQVELLAQREQARKNLKGRTHRRMRRV